MQNTLNTKSKGKQPIGNLERKIPQIKMTRKQKEVGAPQTATPQSFRGESLNKPRKHWIFSRLSSSDILILVCLPLFLISNVYSQPPDNPSA